VQYTNNIVVYGNRPYRLYLTDLDERWRVLKALTHTAHTVIAYTSQYAAGESGGDVVRVPWSDLETLAEASWTNASPRGDLINNHKHFYTTGGGFRRKEALLFGGSHKYAASVPTNGTPRSVQFYAWLDPPYSADTNDVVTFSDFSTGYATNTWNLVGTEADTTNTSVQSADWFPRELAVPLPWVSAPETNALGNIEYILSIGLEDGLEAVAEWDFEYK
jgi:hypothetical protein